MKDYFTRSGIDYANAIISPDQFLSIEYCTEIEPQDFIEFAKTDLRDDSCRGRINAISNSKRAIDCLLHNVLIWLGYGVKDTDNASLQEFVEKFANHNDTSFALRVIQAFDLSPIRLISKIRRIRNTIEHEFTEPKDEEAQEAVELAELFVRAVEYKVDRAMDIEITDKKHKEAKADIYRTGIAILFSDKKLVFRTENGKTQLEPKDLLYPYVLKMMFEISESDGRFLATYRDLVTLLNDQIPYERIQCTIAWA